MCAYSITRAPAQKCCCTFALHFSPLPPPQRSAAAAAPGTFHSQSPGIREEKLPSPPGRTRRTQREFTEKREKPTNQSRQKLRHLETSCDAPRGYKNPFLVAFGTHSSQFSAESRETQQHTVDRDLFRQSAVKIRE